MNEVGAAEFHLSPALLFLRNLWQVNHAVEQRSLRMGKHLGLTTQQRLTLRCIGRFPSIGAAQLARLLHVDAGTLSASLRRLERRGLIERKRNHDDSRQVAVSLTASGRQFDAPRSGTVEAAAELLVSEIAPESLAATARVLRRFSELLDALPAPSSPFGSPGRASILVDYGEGEEVLDERNATENSLQNCSEDGG